MTRIRRYFDEVWSELRKVSWPTREHVRNLTVLVFAISLVIGIYVAVLDGIFQSLVALMAIQWRAARHRTLVLPAEGKLAAP